MTSYVSPELRRVVRDRSHGICEYCLIHESDTFYGCHIDHIISEKHSGPTVPGNLAYACAFCNRAKGSDIGSIASSTTELTPFFNPQEDRWLEHFKLDGVIITPLTPIAEATEAIFGFNKPERIEERQALERIGRFPPPEANAILTPSDA
jgi:hypothetical protein